MEGHANWLELVMLAQNKGETSDEMLQMERKDKKEKGKRA